MEILNALLKSIYLNSLNIEWKKKGINLLEWFRFFDNQSSF